MYTFLHMYKLLLYVITDIHTVKPPLTATFRQMSNVCL